MDAFMPFDINSEAIEGVDWYDRLTVEQTPPNVQQVSKPHRTARVLAFSAQMPCQLLRPTHDALQRHLLGQ